MVGGRTTEQLNGGSLYDGTLSFWPSTIGICLCAVAVAAAARFGHDLSIDEPFMANAVALPWSALWAIFPHDNVPLAYVLLKLWTRVFGRAELGLRSLSLFCYAATIVLSAVAGRRLGGVRTGIIAAVLVGGSTWTGLTLAGTARPYALLSTCVAASTYLLSRRVEKRRLRRSETVAVIAVHLAGLFTHPVYIFHIVGSTVVLASFDRDKRTIGWLLVAPAVYVIAWNRVIAQTIGLGTTSWMPRPTSGDLLRGFTLLWGTYVGLVVVIAAIFSGLMVRHSLRRDWRTVAAMGSVAVIPLVLATVVSLAYPVYLPGRTSVLALPPLAAAIGCLVAQRRRIAAALVVVVVIGVMRFLIMSRSDAGVVATRGAVAAIKAEASCGDTLVAAGLSLSAVEYYLDRLGLPGCLGAVAYPSDMRQHPGWLDEQSRTLEELQREADATVTHVRGPLWLFVASHGIGSRVSGILLDRARAELNCVDRMRVKGGFFDEIWKCTENPKSPATNSAQSARPMREQRR